MTIIKSVLIYIKLAVLGVLIGILYWRDLAAMWQTALSTGWIVFTLAITALVGVFLFQRRKPLKTLISLSETANKKGTIFLLFALILYLMGSYMAYALWLHLYSLLLFIAAYLMLIVDHRIPRMLLLPFTALLFIIPPVGSEIFNVQNSPPQVTLYFIVDIILLVFVSYILITPKRWKSLTTRFLKHDEDSKSEAEAKSCPLCQFNKLQNEIFCPHCGRQRIKPPEFVKPFIAKFLVLTLIVLLVSFIYIPTFSLAYQEASLVLYTSHGLEKHLFLPTLEGWNLESWVRLVDYEKEHLEDFAVEATYISKQSPESRLHVLLEIGSREPYIRNKWNLPSWQRIRQDIPLKGTIYGARYITLRRQDYTVIVLYWTSKLLFKVDSFYSPKYVGISVFSNFTEPLSESKALDVLTTFKNVSLHMINEWNSISRWTLHTSTLGEIYIRSRDFIFATISIIGIFLFAVWVRMKDAEREGLSEHILLLKDNEVNLLAVISAMNLWRFKGAELFEVYKQFFKSNIDVGEFHGIMNKLSNLGFLERKVSFEEHELRLIWKSKL